MPALILALAAAGTAAQQIYKYQDEQGRWHYTDKRPNHDYAVEEDVQTRSFEPPTALVDHVPDKTEKPGQQGHGPYRTGGNAYLFIAFHKSDMGEDPNCGYNRI